MDWIERPVRMQAKTKNRPQTVHRLRAVKAGFPVYSKFIAPCTATLLLYTILGCGVKYELPVVAVCSEFR